MTLKNKGVSNSVMWWMCAGREFQTDGPATENVGSPNLVTVGGTVYDNVSVEEHSPCRRDDAAVVWTVSLM